MDEFNRMCEKAIEGLAEIARKYLADKNVIEYNRLMGKIEGVKLAQDYAMRLTQRALDGAKCAAPDCEEPAIYTIGLCSNHAHPPRQ